jgi:hypothetical protein
VKALFRSFEQSLDGWPGGDLLAGLLLNRGADDTTSAHPAGTVLNLENADAGQSDFVAVLEMASGHHPRHRQEFAETTERGTSLILGRLLLFRLASSRRLY